MKIDYSKWYFTPQSRTYISNKKYFSEMIRLENPSEGISNTFMINVKLCEEISDDPIKTIKELCKKEIRRMCFFRIIDNMLDKQMPVEDNLDYVENEAEKRGLI